MLTRLIIGVIAATMAVTAAVPAQDTKMTQQ